MGKTRPFYRFFLEYSLAPRHNICVDILSLRRSGWFIIVCLSNVFFSECILQGDAEKKIVESSLKQAEIAVEKAYRSSQCFISKKFSNFSFHRFCIN